MISLVVLEGARQEAPYSLYIRVSVDKANHKNTHFKSNYSVIIFYSIPGIIRYCIKEKAKKKALQEDYDKWNEVKNL